MNTNTYSIIQKNYTLELLDLENKKLLESKWFMEFGKFAAEIFDTDENLIYTITKKFKFWKWKMTYKIENSVSEIVVLESQNPQNTIFKADIENDIFEIKINYQQKKSVFKNGKKIAEIDQSFPEENFEKRIQLLVLEEEKPTIVFLLFAALLIGDTNQKSLLKSQKTLIPNEDNWLRE